MRDGKLGPSPLSPRNQRGGGSHSLAGEGVGESQFQRREKKLSTLSTLCVSTCGIKKTLYKHSTVCLFVPWVPSFLHFLNNQFLLAIVYSQELGPFLFAHLKQIRVKSAGSTIHINQKRTDNS
jgi:hypothetical protein